MPLTDTTADRVDRVAMKMWRRAFDAFEAADSVETCDKAAAAALSSHGLRRAVKEMMLGAQKRDYAGSCCAAALCALGVSDAVG